MAFNPAPNAWIPDWSEDGTDISVPIASFPQLTADEANGDTGDIRKLIFALVDKLFAKWAALAAADRPAKMTISRGTSVDDSTGAIRRSYTFTFDLESAGEEVVDES